MIDGLTDGRLNFYIVSYFDTAVLFMFQFPKSSHGLID